MKPFWNSRKLETLKSLMGTHTNQEIADYFETTKKHIDYTLDHFGISRTPEQVRFLQGKHDRFGNQKGDKNNNWKGGISKNNYSYRKRHKERYPERIRAEDKVRRAKQSGKLKPGPCAYYGDRKNIEAHVSDYSNPINSITWLCRSCRIKLQTLKRKLLNMS